MKINFKYFFYGVVSLMILVLLFFIRKGGIEEGLSRCDDVPDGYVVISQATVDSLTAVASATPDTIWNTKWIKGNPKVVERIIYRDTSYAEINCDSSRNFEKNLIDEGIDAWVWIGTKGVVEEFMWGYTPIYKETIKEITVNKPYPVIEERIVKVPQRGLYGTMGAGYGTDLGLGFSIELTWQQSNGLLYGPQVIQIGDNRFYMGKVGFKIF